MSTQTCDCIRVTYTLVGGETGTGLVSATGEYNGRPEYTSISGGLSFTLNWKDGYWRVPGYFTLESDSMCPFGNYSIIGSGIGIFESLVIEPCETEEDKIINCYRLAVWSKQCEYSKCVLEYVNNLIFGVEVCKLQESLKEQRRALEILNCYDPRDILGNTTNYNTITYTKIKQLLNHL